MNGLASKITESEVEVMRVLWESGTDLPLSEIIKALVHKTSWEASTIKTLLRRLCNKGVVSAIKDQVFYYAPLVTESEYNEFITQSLINRLYSGRATNLVASLIASKKLDDADIEELRKLFRVGEADE